MNCGVVLGLLVFLVILLLMFGVIVLFVCGCW